MAAGGDDGVGRIIEALESRRPARGAFIVGVTGSVAVGKSTLAAALASGLSGPEGAPSLSLINTDGFLLPNAVLSERGLQMRKGYPETYDLQALAAALTGARLGAVSIPAYSHIIYDVDPAARTIDRPDILIVEGLALGLNRPTPPGVAGLIDCLVYIDAGEADLETWYVERFLGLWAEAEHDAASFYRRFLALDRAGAEAMARTVWTSINLPNLRANIAPVRELADLVVVKGADHRVREVIARR